MCACKTFSTGKFCAHRVCKSLSFDFILIYLIHCANLSSSESDNLEPESAKVPHIRNHLRISDLSPEFQGLVKYTVADYRSVLSTCGPFPDTMGEQVMAEAVLRCASSALKISMPDATLMQTLIDLVKYNSFGKFQCTNLPSRL